jgi:catechol 2,3-dioxygenase-like lactoylglutathione lyase family enzyme
VDHVVGLEGVRAELAMVGPRTATDGSSWRSFTPRRAGAATGTRRRTPRARHVAFAVDDIDAVVAGLRACGAELVGEVELYEDSCRLCYVRGPEGIIVELAGQIG